MTQTSVTEPTTTLQDLYGDRFTMAVRQAAAIMDKPEYNGRLQMAMDFVLAGAVTLHEDGTATVEAGSHTYEILDECTCQDSQQRSRYCKHFIAVQLLKRTHERLHVRQGNGTAPQSKAEPVAPQPTSWQCAQAPSSCTLKWSVGGIELLLTLRDATDDALFSRIKRVLPRIEEKVQTQRQEQQQAEGYCVIHGVQMKRSKEGDGWFHKAGEKPDGKAIWCRGK